MELPAERPETLLENGRLEIQLARRAEEREVIAMPPDRQNLTALRAEMHVDGSAAAAISTNLKSACCVLGSHTRT
jgi:hypothetical protein